MRWFWQKKPKYPRFTNAGLNEISCAFMDLLGRTIRKNDGESILDVTQITNPEELNKIHPHVWFNTCLWLYCDRGRLANENYKLKKLLNEN